MTMEPPLKPHPQTYLPGMAGSVVLAIAATFLARFVPLAGAPVLAIAFGVLARATLPISEPWTPGLRFSAKYILQIAIITSGFAISLRAVLQTGISTLPVTVVTMSVALGLAALLGRALRLDATLRTLIGIGTAVCGASAIAAVAAVVNPSESELAISIATIFFYNIAAVLTFPIIGHLMQLSQHSFGVWAGTAINDTSSVVAAGYAYGHEAGAFATIVKLTRAMLILPIVAAFAWLQARKVRSAEIAVPWTRIMPWFILWFLAAALVNTTGIIPLRAHGRITEISTFFISVALAAIGLQTKLNELIAAGFRPLIFGGLLWIAVAVTSLVVQRLTGL